MYALVDNATGHVLDFVNLGAFGSSLNVTEQLSSIQETPNMWIVEPATDAPNSRMSEGAINQIYTGIQQQGGNLLFYNSLIGASPNIPGAIFGDPYIAFASFIQSCSWQAGNPLVHYTVEDLTNPEFNEDIVNLSLASIITGLADSMSNSVCIKGFGRAVRPGKAMLQGCKIMLKNCYKGC
jgi:hypothetical protein